MKYTYTLKLYKYILFKTLLLTISANIYSQNYYPAGLPKAKINLWLDANDASTITNPSGIFNWADKANGLKAIAPASSNNPVVNSSLLSGKNVIEFNGTKVLNITPSGSYLDPLTGYNLAQVVYVYNDASTNTTLNPSPGDGRLGTYTRGNTALNKTPALGLHYVSGDSKYEAGILNGSMLGTSLGAVDLRSNWSLLENYAPFTADTTYFTLNAGTTLSNVVTTTAYASTNVSVGNRQQYYTSIHWSIGETILTGVSLQNSGRKIVDCYLANKWGIQANLPIAIQNLYNAPSFSFTNNVLGIGTEGGTDTIAGTGTNNGMGFQNVTGINGFFKEAGNYILAGDNAVSGTVPIGIGFTRWNRTWFIDKTDVGGFGGNINVYFDFNTYGIGTALDTVANKYYLLYNSTSNNFSSGNNYLIPVTSYQQYASSKQLSFLTDAINISNGYYTIVYAAKAISTSGIPLVTNFVSPSISISPAPIITTVFTGNTFNYIYWNADSINYSVAYYKIYASINGGAKTAIDSVYNGSNFYAHYNLTNGLNYQYTVTAVYAVGKESIVSNAVSTVPVTKNLLQWQTIPQYAGTGSVFMKASSPGSTAPIKYYFNCTAGGGHASNYQLSNNYTDVSLTNGNTYTYSFKYMDSTKGVSTESGWSAPISVYLADSAKGGFAYKFAFADNNSLIIPNGIGPTTYSPTTIDTTGLRYIKHAPAPYMHPRIYCNPEDSTDIRWRLKNTASGRAVAKYIHANTVLLQWGYGPGNFSNSANYAKDTLGNPIFSNTGYSNEKPRYDSLCAGDIGVIQNVSNGFGGYADKLANEMANEAFECWIYKGTIDSTTMTSYSIRAARLANAVTLWAKKGLANNSKPVSFLNRDTYGSLQIAFIYDFLYDQMTKGQQDTVRMFIAAMHPTDSSQLHLYNSPSYCTLSNWATFGWEIWNMLALEGETGYSQTDDNTLQNYCRTVLNFLNYGIYSKTGGPVEGIGKNQLNVPMLVALAKRGYSLLGHPAVRAFATKYYPAVMQPFGYSMLGTDLLGGTGTLNAFAYNSNLSAAYGGWKHATSLDPIGLKWAFPNDSTIDFVWKNYMQKVCAGGPTYNYNYRYQDFLGDGAGHAGYWNFLHAAIFATDYSTTPLQTLAQKVYSNNLMYFDSLGGFATLRSGYDTLATALFFHCRTDLGGHTYGNKNDIVYSALGRIWIPRVFTNANSDSPLSGGTGVASSILVNGIGQSVDTSTAATLGILPIPGKFLYYSNKSNAQCVAGDATDAYSYQWSYSFGGYAGDNPLLGGTYIKVLKTMNSYRYANYYNFDDIPLYNKFTQGDYSWLTGPYYYRSVSAPWLNGVFNKMYRTVALVTDPKPYVLVADDAQNNNSVNNYKWVAQIANDLTIDAVFVDTSNNIHFRNDVIFKEPSATGNRRFLIRVLNNKGAANPASPVYIDSVTNPIGSVTPNNKLPRMVIESNSIDPQYKVMLFTYHLNDSLPVTAWNNTKSQLVVRNSGVIKTIGYAFDNTGRTNITVTNGITYYNKPNSDISQISNWGINTNGTGLPPINFTDSVQTFHVSNAGAYINSAFSVTGSGSKLVIDTGYSLAIESSGVLNIPSGSTVDFQGQSVVLQSEVSGTGSIGQIAGTLNNATNLTVQQYIPGNRAFRLMGHSYSSGISLNQLTGIIDITGGDGNAGLGFTSTATNNPSAFWFNTTNGNNALFDGGWTPFTDLTQTNGANAWNKWEGILLFIRGAKGTGLNGADYTPAAVTLSTTGPVNMGTQTISISNSATGWNLVSNPYPSSVNLTAPLASASLSGSYVWNPTGGSGGAYVAIPASTSYVIPSSSAFFVQSTTAGQNLTFNESDKTNGSPATTVFGSKSGLQIDVLKGNDYYDRLYVFADNGSKPAKDNNDMEKLLNPGLSFYSKTSDGTSVSIDSRPIDKSTVIPLYVDTKLPGDYSMSFVNANVETNLYLHDKLKGEYELVEQGKNYSFSVLSSDSTTMGNRFELTAQKNTGLAVDNGVSGIKVDVYYTNTEWILNYSLDKAAQVSVRLVNMQGMQLQQSDLGITTKGQYKISNGNLSEGVYIIELESANIKTLKKIVK